MPLNKTTLEQEIKSALQEKDWDITASKIANAIDVYVKTATVTIPAGVAVATSGSAVAQTGATTAPGVGDLS
jgi:hypothetical protein